MVASRVPPCRRRRRLCVFARPSALQPPTMETNRRLYVARWLAGCPERKRSITASPLISQRSASVADPQHLNRRISSVTVVDLFLRRYSPPEPCHLSHDYALHLVLAK